MDKFSLVFAAISIFIIGYVFGVIGIEDLVLRFIDGYQNLNAVEIIGVTSSMATLLLFAMYIMGRYLMIRRMEITLLETIAVSRNGEMQGFNVVEEIELGETTSESIYLTSTEPIRYIKFYGYNSQVENGKKSIRQYGPLKNGQAIKIKTYLPCGIPTHTIEYQRFDYVKGRLVLSENGKDGLVAESLEIRHTFKSIIYYLVK